jgi:hypothetical protein
MVARRESDGTVFYFFTDRLGTARVMTNAVGVTRQESTYYPFGGEQRQIVNTVDNRYHFTVMERDGLMGLDHTQYREYSSPVARWSRAAGIGECFCFLFRSRKHNAQAMCLLQYRGLWKYAK